MSDAGEKKGKGAKDVSLASMVVAGVWIGTLSLLKAFWHLLAEKEFGLSMEEILLSGIVLAAIFTPVYLSIILDKIRDIRLGGGK
jgi:DMSO/TMAO reductase YedYZ heme-binding membrane subunit